MGKLFPEQSVRRTRTTTLCIYMRSANLDASSNIHTSNPQSTPLISLSYSAQAGLFQQLPHISLCSHPSPASAEWLSNCRGRRKGLQIQGPDHRPAAPRHLLSGLASLLSRQDWARVTSTPTYSTHSIGPIPGVPQLLSERAMKIACLHCLS